MDVIFCLFCCGERDGYRLLDAARYGDAASCQRLVEKTPKTVATAHQWGGQTVFHIAAREGHADVLEALADTLRSGDPTAVRQLAQLGDTAEDIIEALVQTPDSKGLTPLHLSCIKGHAKATEVLMQLGANPFAMDSVGRTPLHYAASWGFADCINAVLGYHSGPPKEGWSYVWPNNGTTRLVDVQNAAGFTPLHYAVWVGRKEAIQALASYDASLKVVNTGNDYEWIRVGSGNTPLHLAAFGGDLSVVKLLLAAYVQSLAAGSEVMTAARGQWGTSPTDDVRHVRNRRGWMPYHIAMHKGFEHLAELLHPDIPYTFIFSNDDMEPGSVRMFGPARLMVIAAKALQQKLVDELAAVQTAAEEAAAAAGGGSPGVIKALPGTVVTEAAAAPEGDTEGGDVFLPLTVSAPAVIGAPVGSSAAEAATAEAPAPAPSLPGAFVSPFAAKSTRGWTQSSFSAGASSGPASAATSAAPAPAGPSAASTPNGSLTPASTVGAEARGSSSAAVAAVAAAAAAAAAAMPGVVSCAATSTEHSFSGPDLQVYPSAPAAVDAVKHTNDNDSFGGFTPAQQQQRDNASVSDAGLSGSTIHGSVSAVAGSAPGSISFGPFSQDSSSHKLPPSILLSATGSPAAMADTSSSTRGVQWAPQSTAAADRVRSRQQYFAGGNRAALEDKQQDRHRRVQSATAASYSRQGSRGGYSDTTAGVRDGEDQQQPKFGWRMESLKRRGSHKDFRDMLPPSAVQTSADDDLDHAANGGAGGTASNFNSSSRRNSLTTPAGSSTAGPSSVRRISSLPSGVGSHTATAAAPGAAALDARQGTQQQQQVMLRRSSTDLHDPAHENPLNVVLAARAGQIGDNPEAIRQQLLAMKLASGALHFNNAVSTFAASLAGSASCEQVVSRFTSFSSAMPPSSRNSISSRPGAAPAPAAAVATLSLEARDAGVEAGLLAAAGSSGAEPSPFSSQQQQQQQSGTPSLSPSPSMFNITAANVMAHQSSQSLQRLLSGNMRTRRAASAAVGVQYSSSVPSPSGLSMVAGPNGAFASQNSSPAAAAATAAAGGRGAVTNGDLPIVQQQQLQGAAAVIFSEGDDGDDEEGTCEICFDAAAVVALERCGHTLCVGCCKELCKLHHFKPGLCPYCRQIICGFSRATHVFIP